MKLSFWGVRGSIPTPGPGTVRYGGNTTCVSVEIKGEWIIFDMGTGARVLGKKLIQEGFLGNGREANIFFTHSHWDHIQGFPFFLPAFEAGNTLHLYGEDKEAQGLRRALENQQEYPSFPVTLEQMPAKFEFYHLKEGQQITLYKDIVITNCKLNHPNGSFAYRIDCQNKSIVFATDTETDENLSPKLIKLADKAQILIHDAQYTPQEYFGVSGKSKIGWGHSTYEDAIKIAREAQVGTLILTHHDPDHNDEELDYILEEARKLAPKGLTLLMAQEKMQILL